MEHCPLSLRKFIKAVRARSCVVLESFFTVMVLLDPSILKALKQRQSGTVGVSPVQMPIQMQVQSFHSYMYVSTFLVLRFCVQLSLNNKTIANLCLVV